MRPDQRQHLRTKARNQQRDIMKLEGVQRAAALVKAAADADDGNKHFLYSNLFMFGNKARENRAAVINAVRSFLKLPEFHDNYCTNRPEDWQFYRYDIKRAALAVLAK
jgi:hypothetical protein